MTTPTRRGFLSGWCLLATAITSASVVSLSAQARPYNLIMKDVATASGALRKSVEASDFTVSAEQARRLEQLFKETEEFWTRFKTKDAVDAAAGARELSASIAAAAGAKDASKMKSTVSGLGRFCTTCHDSHREQMPDKSYRIRP
jgi:plasmid maintenance system antidote protein VapI